MLTLLLTLSVTIPFQDQDQPNDFLQHFKNAVQSIEKGIQAVKDWAQETMDEMMQKAQDPMALQETINKINEKVIAVMDFLKELQEKFIPIPDWNWDWYRDQSEDY